MTVTNEDRGYGPFNPEPTGTTEIKDFSSHAEPVRFRIDDDIFEAPAVIPAQVMLDFVSNFNTLGENANQDAQGSAMMAMIDMVLKPESAVRFKHRMGDGDHPIGLDQIQDILPWLMEKYGMRPTEPSDILSDGQADQGTGTDSTQTSPAPGSTSVVSNLSDFSTSSTAR